MNDRSATVRAMRRAASDDEQIGGTIVRADLRGIRLAVDGVECVVPRTECALGLLRTAQVGATWRGYVVEVADSEVICSGFARPTRVARSERRARFVNAVSLGSVVTGKVIGQEPAQPDTRARDLVLLYHEMVWGAVPTHLPPSTLEEGRSARFRIVAFAEPHDRDLDVFVWPAALEWRP